MRAVNAVSMIASLVASCETHATSTTTPTISAATLAPNDPVFAAAADLLIWRLGPNAETREPSVVTASLSRIVCKHDPTIEPAAAGAVLAASIRDAYPSFYGKPLPTALACGRFFIDSQEYAGKALQQYRLQHPNITPQPMPPRLPPIDETIVPPPPP